MSAAPHDFAAIIEPVARHILGEPNTKLSTRRELRFGSHGSLAVHIAGERKGTWHDFEAGDGGGVLDLLKTRKNLVDGAAIAWLEDHSFIQKRERAQRPMPGPIVKAYDYRGADGALLFQVTRHAIPEKTFRQRRPDGNGGWIPNLEGVERVLYRLPELLAAQPGSTVFICEGEKDVDNLRDHLLIATTNSGGAGKWSDKYAEPLRGKHCVVLPDNDPQAKDDKTGKLRFHPDGTPVLPGQDHADQVAQSLAGIAASVKVLMLPDLPPKGDVSDWLAAGGTAELLERLAADAEPQPAPDESTQEAEDFRPPEFTDEALALRFAERHKGHLRYVAAWGQWLIREPTVWRFDETLKAFDMSRAVCRQASAECNHKKVAAAVASAKTVAAVERLAKADRRHAATIDQWDAMPWLLNTPGGVIDLRTGKMFTHRPDDYLTKRTAVAPGGDCPRWLQFLDRVTGGDADLQAFIQRAAGHCLTGSVREHALFFGFGTGANGKGTLLNTLTGIMGDYAAVASMETFTASSNDRHPTDLAMLRGARLVTAQETEEGRRWAEARIKALTGGDPITARFMRQDFFTYVPQFKLFIAGNHKPALRGVDEAIRRRFHLIPFNVRIPPAERDPDLGNKLKAEWPGILDWMVRGCLEWQRTRLCPPAAVTQATASYLDAEDALGLWLAEYCDQSQFLWGGSSDLFANWRLWAEAAGEYVGSQKRFSQALEARGFTPKRDPRGGKAGFQGIAAVRRPDTGRGRWNDA